jgi:D-glycero-D-manno-heptose 1,7-bisphosphate phosphatase
MKKAIFLDRDGVINKPVIREGKPYPPSSVKELELMPGVAEGCKMLRSAGYLLIIATNQPDVGRGTMSQDVVEEIHRHLQTEIGFDGIEVCYDSGNGGLEYPMRKPAPGMLFHAASNMDIDLTGSWMIGDRWRDVDCGLNAGCRTIFIDCNYSEKLRSIPHFTVKNFSEAVSRILES